MKKLLLGSLLVITFIFCSCSTISKDDLAKAAEHAKNGGTQSREYSANEIITRAKAQSLYVYEGKKASSKEPLPALVKLENNKGENINYIILPSEEMSINQFLQLSELTLTPDFIAKRTPLQDELQYSDVKAMVQPILTEYKFLNEISEMYPFYLPSSNAEMSGIWSVLVFTSDNCEYEVQLYSDNKEVKSILRQNSSTSDGSSSVSSSSDGLYTDDKVLNAAEAYYKSLGLPSASSIILQEKAVDSKICYGNNKKIDFSNDTHSVSIYVNLSDLSISGIQLFNLSNSPF